MSITATVESRKIEVILPPGVDWPDGTVVRIEAVEEKKISVWEVLKKYEGLATDLPPDFAENLDHYVHGHPKK